MARQVKEVAADNAAVVARLVTVLENPDLADIALLSERDGTKTTAPAFQLASCSPVFLRMLTGPFSEGLNRNCKRTKTSADADTSLSRYSSLPAVSCAFSGEALATVVSFAATNDAPSLSSGSVDLLIEILEVATYYDIEGLLAKARSKAIAMLLSFPEKLARYWRLCGEVESSRI